ncbi:hypothetical protein LCGC14_1565080 [marine sediment metagenome]|uniref:Uncharacterized protein n=1 Tax=marine sediment metagenome TaxID=412755 RepID=A0A0F9J7G2_9ZZZZ
MRGYLSIVVEYSSTSDDQKNKSYHEDTLLTGEFNKLSAIQSTINIVPDMVKRVMDKAIEEERVRREVAIGPEP